MVLSALASVVTSLDEEVLRQHAKLAEFIEKRDERLNKDTISDILSASSTYLYSTHVFLPETSDALDALRDLPAEAKASLYLSMLWGIGSYLNLFTIGKDFESKTTPKDLDYHVRGMSRILRLPSFLGGMLSTAYSLYEMSGGNSSINLYTLLVPGIVTAGACALYLKDVKPDTATRQPLWKRVYDRVTLNSSSKSDKDNSSYSIT